MKLSNFQKLVTDSLDLINKEFTLSMPFNEYHELMTDCMNSPMFLCSSKDKSSSIKQFRINGAIIFIIEGEEIKLRSGRPGENEKIFESIKFEPLPHQKNP